MIVPLRTVWVWGNLSAVLRTQADMIARPVYRPVVAEATSLGAAFAAGLAVRCVRAPRPSGAAIVRLRAGGRVAGHRFVARHMGAARQLGARAWCGGGAPQGAERLAMSLAAPAAPAAREALFADWRRAVDRSLGWAVDPRADPVPSDAVIEHTSAPAVPSGAADPATTGSARSRVAGVARAAVQYALMGAAVALLAALIAAPFARESPKRAHSV